MSIRHARVVVGTTPTLVSTMPALNPPGHLIVQNTGASSVYLGANDVSTTSYGYELKANTELKIDRILLSELLYGVVTTGTVTINVLTQGAN